jgi:hypothetical protein
MSSQRQVEAVLCAIRRESIGNCARVKLERLENEKIDPYELLRTEELIGQICQITLNLERTHSCGELRAQDIGNMTPMGCGARVTWRTDFIDLRDRAGNPGLCQLQDAQRLTQRRKNCAASMSSLSVVN